MKKAGNTLTFVIIHFCLIITIISLIWSINIIALGEIDKKPLLEKIAIGFIILILGIGGIGIYLTLVPKLIEVEELLTNMKRGNNK